MKRLCIWVFCGVVMFSSCQSRLENYRPMLVSGYQWDIETISNADPMQTTKQSITVSGDTIVNNKIYKKIIAFSSNSKEGKEDWQIYGLLYEDVAQQKIYYLTQDREELLYDFGMKIGDKTHLYLSNLINQRNVDYYLTLKEIRNQQDLQKQLYREFMYDVYMKTNDEKYEKVGTHITMERYGSKTGIISNNSVVLDGGTSSSLVAAYNENGVLSWSKEQ